MGECDKKGDVVKGEKWQKWGQASVGGGGFGVDAGGWKLGVFRHLSCAPGIGGGGKSDDLTIVGHAL